MIECDGIIYDILGLELYDCSNMRVEISGIHEHERYEIQRICFGLSYISHLRVVLRVLLNYYLSFLNAIIRKKGGVVLVFC